MPLLGTGILVNYLKENYYKEGMNKDDFKEAVFKNENGFDEEFIDVAYQLITFR